jgi:hypothetical protein
MLVVRFIIQFIPDRFTFALFNGKLSSPAHKCTIQHTIHSIQSPSGNYGLTFVPTLRINSDISDSHSGGQMLLRAHNFFPFSLGF